MLLLVTLLFYASLLSLALIPIIPSYDETGGATTHHKLYIVSNKRLAPTVSVSDGNLDMKLCNMTMGGGDSWQYKMQRFGGDIL